MRIGGGNGRWRWLGFGLLLVVVLLFGWLSVANAGSRAGVLPTRAACSSSYVEAHLSWGTKCLRVGEFCKVENPEYRAYGFDCPAGGVERWTVKTLQDRPRLLRARKTTLHFLVTRPAPHPQRQPGTGAHR